jgi:hypothetical protein
MAEDKANTRNEGARAPQQDTGGAGVQRTPVAGSVRYGSEQSVRAGAGIGRDEEPHTADGEIAPGASGRGGTGADDRFVSSEVQERASQRGPRSRTTS